MLRREIFVWFLPATYGKVLWKYSWMESGEELVMIVQPLLIPSGIELVQSISLLMLELSVDSLDTIHMVRY